MLLTLEDKLLALASTLLDETLLGNEALLLEEDSLTLDELELRLLDEATLAVLIIAELADEAKD